MLATTKPRMTDKSRTMSLIIEHIEGQIESGNLTPSIALITDSIVDSSIDHDAPTIVRQYLSSSTEQEVVRYWREACNRVSENKGMICHPVTSTFFKRRRTEADLANIEVDVARTYVAGVAKGRGKPTAGSRFLEAIFEEPSDDMMLAVYLKGFAAVHDGQRKKGLRLLQFAEQAKRLTHETRNQLLLELKGI